MVYLNDEYFSKLLPLFRSASFSVCFILNNGGIILNNARIEKKKKMKKSQLQATEIFHAAKQYGHTIICYEYEYPIRFSQRSGTQHTIYINFTLISFFLCKQTKNQSKKNILLQITMF